MVEGQQVEEHGAVSLTPFLLVFAALAVFTIISFIVNGAVKSESLSREMGFTLILSVAVVKAVLVGMFFMHLKWDWGRVYFLIIPGIILGALLVIVLLPDVVLAWKQATPP